MPGDTMPPAPIHAVPGGDPLTMLFGSHERRLELVEHQQSEIVAKVASIAATSEQCVEGVRALDAKLDQLPAQLQAHFTAIVTPIHERVDHVVKAIEEHAPIVERARKDQESEDERGKKRTASMERYKAALITIVAATIGAGGKAVVDLFASWWRANHGG